MLIPDRDTPHALPAARSTARPATSSPSTRVGGRLDREWRRLRHDRRSLGQVRCWRTDEPDAPSSTPSDPLDEAIRRATIARDLEAIVAATHRHGGGDPDAVLRRLVDLAVDDPLAGRIVLQRLLPGLLAAARRYHRPWDGADMLDHAVAAAWIAVRSFDVTCRRGPVAPSLISDAMSIGYRNAQRRHAAHPELPSDPAEWARRPASTERPAVEELAGMVREARELGVAEHDLELVRHLVSTGSPGRVAIERGVTPRTVRNHRDRAIANIRRAVLEAA